MKKWIVRLVLLTLVIVLALAVNYLWKALPIISAYGAKNLCSCVFVSGRTAESVIAEELAVGLLSFGSFHIDPENNKATGSVFGLASREAIYREGLGCTLVNGISAERLRKQAFNLIEPSIHQDTVPWPTGNFISDSARKLLANPKLATVVEQAFTDDRYINPSGTRAVVVLKDSLLLAEKYAPGYNRNTRQLGWSMTKSLMGTAIGLLRYSNDFPDINEPVPFNRWSGEGSDKSKITTNDLLQMSSGLEWLEFYGGPSDATNMLFLSYSAADIAAAVPLEFEPGTFWEYSSGTSNILSQIVQEKIGDDAYHKFWQERLFYTIGMNSALMEPDPSGTYVGSSFMWATPLDWARFGLLYLQDGVWNGKRLLPEGWVEYSKAVAPASSGRYGAQFWLNAKDPEGKVAQRLPDVPEDTYIASGFQGQRVFIIPSEGLVIVRLGLDPLENFDFNLWVSEVIESLKQ